MRAWWFALTLVFASIHAAPARACTCIAPGTDDEETRRADVVFVGTVTTIVDPKRAQPSAVAQIAVETAIKGAHANTTITIYAASGSAMCGFQFELGKRYKVFAFKNDRGELTTRMCTASRQL